jgi:DNA-binding transcriptional ArsR family regulator
LTETDTYDLIFAALKNPIRREILLFLEEKGEASFTDIQKVVNTTDTGLLSYHLKELNLLIEQSTRGKYSLSEIGQTSITLFRKVEKEQGHIVKAVRNEIESYVGKIFFLFPIIAITWMIPACIDMLASVDVIMDSVSSLQFLGMQLVGFAGVVFGLVLFVVYDRHYYSKNLKTNAIHATFFAFGVSLLVLLTFSSIYNFTQATLSVGASSKTETQWLMIGVLRSICFVAVAPFVAYVFDRTAKRR